jgi:hypothetical protein
MKRLELSTFCMASKGHSMESLRSSTSSVFRHRVGNRFDPAKLHAVIGRFAGRWLERGEVD